MPTLETHAKATSWPPLPYDEWKDTLDTLHLWTQIVGKIRLAQAPMVNHWWQVTLYVTPRGLTTSSIPYGDAHVRDRIRLLRPSAPDHDRRGETARSRCSRKTVADFYGEVMDALGSLGLDIAIGTVPCEIRARDPVRPGHRTRHL